MSELFDAQMIESKSPRLKWIERHSVVTAKAFDKRISMDKWTAWRSIATCYDKHGEGLTEDDALADWARRNGVRLWNEE